MHPALAAATLMEDLQRWFDLQTPDTTLQILFDVEHLSTDLVCHILAKAH